MDAHSSDFLATPSRSRASGSGLAAAWRKGWAFLLPLVIFLPVGISLLSSHAHKVSPPKSFTQKLQEEKIASEAPAGSDPEGLPPSSELPLAAAAEPVPEETPPGDSTTTLVETTKPEDPKAEPNSSPKTSDSPGSIRYRVRSGDTLSEIAQRSGVSAAEIMAANQIQAQDLIFAGQELTIPNVSEEKRRALSLTQVDPKAPAPALPAPPAVQPPTSGSTRTVVLGPPVPKPAPTPPFPVSGLPAPVAKVQAGAGPASAHRSVVLDSAVSPDKSPKPGQSTPRPVVLGPPVRPAPKMIPPSSFSTGTSQSEQPGPALPARHQAGEFGYLPLNSQQPRETVTAASAVEVRPGEAGGDPAGSGLISYLVQPFDTIASIAKAHGTSADQIIRLNGTGPLREGQTLLLPISQNKLATSAAVP